MLTHWGRATHICVGKLTTIGSDNSLSPGRRQAIIWTNARILLIGPWGTNFSEILIKIYAFLFTKMHLKMSSGKWRPLCLGLDVLTHGGRDKMAAIFQTASSNAFSCVQLCCVLIHISLEFLPDGTTNKKTALVWIMAWHRTRWKAYVWSDNGLLTHTCVTRFDGLVLLHKLTPRLKITLPILNTTNINIHHWFKIRWVIVH